MLLEQQHRIFKILNYQDYKKKYFTHRQWISLIHTLETVQPSKQNLLYITTLVQIIGISLIDHLQIFISRLRNASQVVVSLVQEFVVTCLSKFNAVEQIQLFQQLHQLSMEITKDNVSQYLRSSQQNDNNIDKIWLKYYELNEDAFLFLEQVKPLSLNYLEYLLLKKIYFHYLHHEIQQFSFNKLNKITNEVPLCCRTYFTVGQNLLDQTFYDQTLIQYKSQLPSFNEENLRQTICGYLNTKGGMIIYGMQCHSLYNRVVGTVVNSDEMQKSKNLMRILMGDFYPDTLSKKLYQFEYLPVKNKEGEYNKGTFVLRIKIFGGQKTHLYHYKVSQQQKIFIRQGRRNKLVQLQQIYELIRHKVLVEQNNKLIIHQGQCQQPQNGIQLYSNTSNRYENTNKTYKNSANNNNINVNINMNYNFSNKNSYNYQNSHNDNNNNLTNNKCNNSNNNKKYRQKVTNSNNNPKKQGPKYVALQQTFKRHLTIVTDIDLKKYIETQSKFRELKYDVYVQLSEYKDIIGVWHNQKFQKIIKVLQSEVFLQKRSYLNVKNPDVLILENTDKQFSNIVLGLLRERNIKCQFKKKSLFFSKFEEAFFAFCFLYNTEIKVRFQSN